MIIEYYAIIDLAIYIVVYIIVYIAVYRCILLYIVVCNCGIWLYSVVWYLFVRSIIFVVPWR